MKTFREWYTESFKELEKLGIGIGFGNKVTKVDPNSWSGYRVGQIKPCQITQDTAPESLYIYHDWSMGGSHGNCWDDSMYHSEGEEKRQFVELGMIIDFIKPDLSYKVFNEKVLPLVTIDSISVGEYYGGHSTTGYEYISLEKLWYVLNEV